MVSSSGFHPAPCRRAVLPHLLTRALCGAVRAAPVEKPRYTYEQLLVSVLEPDRQLTFTEIIAEIQNRYPYYNNGAR